MNTPEHGVMRFACGHESLVCRCTEHLAAAPIDVDVLCLPCRSKLSQPLTPTAPPLVTEPFPPATD